MRKLALLYMTFILPFFMFGCGKTTDNEINFSSSSETTEQFSEKTNASGNETVSSESESNLKEICPDSVWLEGKRFLESSSHDDIADWVDNMNF